MADMLQYGLDALAKFFMHSEIRNAHIHGGIDPGAHGAIGLICGPFATVMDIPTETLVRAGKTKTGSQKTTTAFDEPAILALFDALDEYLVKRNCSLSICLERAQIVVIRKGGKAGPKGAGGNGAYGAYRVGYGFGLWPLFLRSRGYGLTVENPQKWKKVMGLSGEGKGKGHSRALASRRWPDADLKRVRDHDRAEALLLAAYLRKVEE